MKQGICIQIGIGYTPEYIYLTEPDWKRRVSHMHPIWQIPPQLMSEVDEWQYFGIDSDPFSLAYPMRTYEHRDNVSWVCTYLSNTDKHMVTTHSNLFDSKSELREGMLFHVAVTTFDAVLDHLNITQIDLLAIDIEGGEYDLLEKYSWRYLPRYIAVEVHGNPPIGPDGVRENVGHMLELLFDYGYRCIRKIPTNIRNNQAHTLELQLLSNRSNKGGDINGL